MKEETTKKSKEQLDLWVRPQQPLPALTTADRRNRVVVVTAT
jgi:hypothetical protein